MDQCCAPFGCLAARMQSGAVLTLSRAIPEPWSAFASARDRVGINESGVDESMQVLPRCVVVQPSGLRELRNGL